MESGSRVNNGWNNNWPHSNNEHNEQGFSYFITFPSTTTSIAPPCQITTTISNEFTSLPPSTIINVVSFVEICGKIFITLNPMTYIIFHPYLETNTSSLHSKPLNNIHFLYFSEKFYMMISVADRGVDKLNLGPEKANQLFEKENIMGGLPKCVEPINRKELEQSKEIWG